MADPGPYVKALPDEDRVQIGYVTDSHDAVELVELTPEEARTLAVVLIPAALNRLQRARDAR